jgi:hypothetical protein
MAAVLSVFFAKTAENSEITAGISLFFSSWEYRNLGFRREPAIGRCKFTARTAKNSETPPVDSFPRAQQKSREDLPLRLFSQKEMNAAVSAAPAGKFRP